MSKAYRVRDWNELFETHESRKIKSCKFVYVPNKQDGSGYRQMVTHRHAERLFCAWNAIIQVASKMPERGLLVDKGKPVTARDMHFKTGFREDTFEMAFEFFSSNGMDWIEEIDLNSKERPDTSGEAGRSREILPAGGSFSALKGIEGKGIEVKNSLSLPSPESRATHCIGLYPTHREPQGRERERIVWGKKDKEKLIAAITADPAYPFEFVFGLASKETRAVKSPANFVENLPDLKPLAPDLKRALEKAAKAIKAEHPEFPDTGYGDLCIPFMDVETLLLLEAYRRAK